MIFTRLPELFFAPLASPNRHHYASLLLIYYRLFLEYHHGVERELVVDRFASYFAALDSPDGARGLLEQEDEADSRDPRNLATHVLRRLISYGWMDEEEQLDFTRLVTITSHARPFFEALDATDRGAAVEYESHIVAVYSSLTGDSAYEHGEHAVLNAHYHTRMLIESLKVLEQNIRAHVQSLFDHDQSIPEILRSHYDVYMHEVVDRAYTRLKTSDNLSRYRPRIARAIGGFLNDESWLEQTAGKLSLIQRVDATTARERVRATLVEIRDDLASIDPILESIDDRNRRYSRISTERIRAQLHADTSLQGRIAVLVGAIADG
ncbi:MAG: Wadjet anti-phage system protein JetA family protein, partial [Spirochaetota bacterium]